MGITERSKFFVVGIVLAIIFQACSLTKALTTDGTGGPTPFSFHKRDKDTIFTSDKPFSFAVLPKEFRALDTMKICESVSGDMMQTITERMSSLSPNQTIIVIRNDSIIYEKSFGSYTPLTIATVYSISKSLTSLLCGIAIDEGYICSIDDPVTDYLPELADKDSGWSKLTLRHLLNMQSGIDMSDAYSLKLSDIGKLKKMADLQYGSDVMKLVSRLKFKNEPGLKRVYRSIDTQVLGLVIERAVGQTFAQYMTDKVWKPLGMDSNAFITIDSHEHHHAHVFGGIATNAIDLAKIGRLYLNGGEWNGCRIVSEEWIRQSTAIDTSNESYHYCWYSTAKWNETSPENSGTYAVGIHGQILYINPAKNLIMVRMGENNDEYHDASWIFDKMAKML